jgi:hypothetical protein
MLIDVEMWSRKTTGSGVTHRRADYFNFQLLLDNAQFHSYLSLLAT